MPNDPILAAAVKRATAAVQQTAASPTNGMSSIAVAEAKPELQAAITEAIAPVIANVTNTEAHWWQKRSSWAAIASSGAAISAGIVTTLQYLADHSPEKGTLSLVTVGFAVWSGYSAARAGIAKTPLGSRPSDNPVAYRG